MTRKQENRFRKYALLLLLLPLLLLLLLLLMCVIAVTFGGGGGSVVMVVMLQFLLLVWFCDFHCGRDGGSGTGCSENAAGTTDPERSMRGRLSAHTVPVVAACVTRTSSEGHTAVPPPSSAGYSQ